MTREGLVPERGRLRFCSLAVLRIFFASSAPGCRGRRHAPTDFAPSLGNRIGPFAGSGQAAVPEVLHHGAVHDELVVQPDPGAVANLGDMNWFHSPNGRAGCSTLRGSRPNCARRVIEHRQKPRYGLRVGLFGRRPDSSPRSAPGACRADRCRCRPCDSLILINNSMSPNSSSVVAYGPCPRQADQLVAPDGPAPRKICTLPREVRASFFRLRQLRSVVRAWVQAMPAREIAAIKNCAEPRGGFGLLGMDLHASPRWQRRAGCGAP